MGSKRFKYSRYGMYTNIEQALQFLDLKVGPCLIIGDSLKGKGKPADLIKNTALLDMLPTGCEVLAPSYPDVDVQALPYEDNSFEYVLADQVFEHVKKPWIGIKEIHRVLKPNGLLVLTSALLFRVHSIPNDYWRFTPDALKVLCEDFSEIITCGGTGDLAFAIDVLKETKHPAVIPGSEEARKACASDGKHTVSVWITAKK